MIVGAVYPSTRSLVPVGPCSNSDGIQPYQFEPVAVSANDGRELRRATESSAISANKEAYLHDISLW